MELSKHTVADLFLQLGLPSETGDIERFVETHRPLPDDVRLPDASFWSASQSQFLREELIEDADWAEVVDRLSVMLRS